MESSILKFLPGPSTASPPMRKAHPGESCGKLLFRNGNTRVLHLCGPTELTVSHNTISTPNGSNLDRNSTRPDGVEKSTRAESVSHSFAQDIAPVGTLS